MGKTNVLSGLVLLGASLVITVEAIELSPGSLRSPGPGLYPLVLGVILGILSAALCLTGLAGRRADRGAEPAPAGHTGQVCATIVTLLAYPALLPDLGYPTVTVLLLGALFRIGGMRGWLRVAGLAVAFTASVGVLCALLGVRLPPGAVWEAFGVGSDGA